MKKFVFLLVTILIYHIGNAQHVSQPAFDHELRRILSLDVPTLTVSEADVTEGALYLDAREQEEYQISHIPGAILIGFDHFDIEKLKPKINKNETLIVYCSVGYRSEKIVKKLIKAGYSKVYNLYGSLFEWANCNLPLENEKGDPTNQIHTYDKKWSQWVINDTLQKVW